MTVNGLKTPFKSLSDIENLYNSSPMHISVKIAKNLAYPEKEIPQEMQEITKSITNLTIIVNLIDIEMQNK